MLFHASRFSVHLGVSCFLGLSYSTLRSKNIPARAHTTNAHIPTRTHKWILALTLKYCRWDDFSSLFSSLFSSATSVFQFSSWFVRVFNTLFHPSLKTTVTLTNKSRKSYGKKRRIIVLRDFQDLPKWRQTNCILAGLSCRLTTGTT